MDEKKLAREVKAKNSQIYKADLLEKKNAEAAAAAAASSSTRRTGSFTKINERNETYLPTHDAQETYDDYGGADEPLNPEPMQRFPMPNQTPMMRTSAGYMSNIKGSTKMRLTQV